MDLWALLYLARLENGSGFAVLPGRFQRDITFSVTVKHSEKIIVGASHYDAAEEEMTVLGYWDDLMHASLHVSVNMEEVLPVGSIPDTLKLVKDAVVLIQGT